VDTSYKNVLSKTISYK